VYVFVCGSKVKVLRNAEREVPSAQVGSDPDSPVQPSSVATPLHEPANGDSIGGFINGEAGAPPQPAAIAATRPMANVVRNYRS
jgi:hypothetical protein